MYYFFLIYNIFVMFLIISNQHEEHVPSESDEIFALFLPQFVSGWCTMFKSWSLSKHGKYAET